MIIIVLGLAIILAVIAYNMYQESQYRKQVREQFGHSDKDALLNSKTNMVRDGKEQGSGGLGKVLIPKKTSKAQEAALRNLQEQDALFAAKLSKASTTKPDVEIQMEDDFSHEPIKQTTIDLDGKVTNQTITQSSSKAATPTIHNQPLVSLEELTQVDLPWFDQRFDYLAYVALNEAQELHSLPRLSSRHRFQIIGCTMDDRFQVAEPIPGVYYQAFIMGLQAVSRNGLATQDELIQFNQQVETFAQLTDGKVMLTDMQAFSEVSQALDSLCARVDQTIAIHLVSRTNITGTELRSAVESVGFTLADDGMFHFSGNNTQTIFNISTLDNTAFTSSLLANQTYRGFSMLFDIPHVPAGEKTFDQFMELAVKLSGQLGLDLVNDHMEELSAQWLKNVRTYVLARQEEMLKVGIKPSSKQAKRLFS